VGRRRRADWEVEREAEILVHPGAEGSSGRIAFEQIGAFTSRTRSGPCSIAGLRTAFALKACPGDKSESFREGINLEREDQVHRELDGLARTVGPQVEHFCPSRLRMGLGGFNVSASPPTMKIIRLSWLPSRRR